MRQRRIRGHTPSIVSLQARHRMESRDVLTYKHQSSGNAKWAILCRELAKARDTCPPPALQALLERTRIITSVRSTLHAYDRRLRVVHRKNLYLLRKHQAQANSKIIPWTPSLDIKFTGNVDKSMPIFDLCDNVRYKIREHMHTTSRSAALFLREITRAGWPARPSWMQSKQFSDFLAKEHTTVGSTSRAFYGAYVCFEKRRIFTDRLKPNHCFDMEDEWSIGGLLRERSWNTTYVVGVGVPILQYATFVYSASVSLKTN
ncbi:hypothetical protein K488DRAFT_70843 [Vararia minispora EC-137]|uniref:Uncharacterized protein n=1 Tax=Vararia minispora EC-137 TaxID=1314806 RepID=A0ACB8QKN5_9AGAM|nr:hypothetical protein K488DRAFT_70843 [Vararia minispora EC-137]